MALPRRLFVHETTDVVNPPKGLGTSKYVKEADGTYTAYTLGMRPLDDVVDAIRQGGKYKSTKGSWWSHEIHGWLSPRTGVEKRIMANTPKGVNT